VLGGKGFHGIFIGETNWPTKNPSHFSKQSWVQHVFFHMGSIDENGLELLFFVG